MGIGWSCRAGSSNGRTIRCCMRVCCVFGQLRLVGKLGCQSLASLDECFSSFSFSHTLEMDGVRLGWEAKEKLSSLFSLLALLAELCWIMSFWCFCCCCCPCGPCSVSCLAGHQMESPMEPWHAMSMDHGPKKSEI